ncbi:MAG TPA: alpha/beta hydrolase domain-containing protein [Bryobacterales bacterium]|nr:alpha/beta hydrolase domain-containing protein [Bryobacterales bacterium]
MIIRLLLAVALFYAAASAAVVRVEIQSRSDVLGGRSFGLAGPYEKLVGKAYFSVDPSNPINRIIADIDKAPRNAEGKVEFAADLYVLQPKQIERGNGAVLFEVCNRGRKGMLGMFNRASGSLDPTSERDFGDGFLMRQGYTLAWLGWQPDVPELANLLRLYAPHAPGIKGLVRNEFIPTKTVTSELLSDRDHLPYLVADPGDPSAVLYVRDRVESPRRTIPRDQWKFSADRGHIEMPSGFEPHRIYEAVYTSEDPVLIGLGPTAVRDLMSHMKYDDAAPLARVRRAYGFGTSQSGRFLRAFLYYGFNQDESGRQVFDAMIPHVAGACRGSFNHRFAQPSRDVHPFMNLFYPTDIFPFTDLDETDPETGVTDGLLDRAEKTHTVPKIFYTNGSYEYWGRSASLIHTTPDGRADAAIPANVRIYLFAGAQHGPASFPPARTIGQQLANPNDFRWAMRALLVAMDRWVTEGVEPPPSAYPRIANGTLAAPATLRFPKIPGANFPTRFHNAYRLDFGPQWKAGIISVEPPKIVGKPFPAQVSQVDADGNETGGLKMPELAVPLATYAGWNLFNAGAGPTDEISSMVGSYIPFARTRAGRERSGDPRPSIEERYHGRDQYLGLVSEAAMKLIDQGYLLGRDLPGILKQAAGRWDYCAGGQRAPETGEAAAR